MSEVELNMSAVSQATYRQPIVKDNMKYVTD